jgi:hypothetical protein
MCCIFIYYSLLLIMRLMFCTAHYCAGDEIENEIGGNVERMGGEERRKWGFGGET